VIGLRRFGELVKSIPKTFMEFSRALSLQVGGIGRSSSLLRLTDHARPLAQFDVLRRVYEERLVERGLADFVVTSADDYLLSTGLQPSDLER